MQWRNRGKFHTQFRREPTKNHVLNLLSCVITHEHSRWDRSSLLSKIIHNACWTVHGYASIQKSEQHEKAHHRRCGCQVKSFCHTQFGEAWCNRLNTMLGIPNSASAHSHCRNNSNKNTKLHDVEFVPQFRKNGSIVIWQQRTQFYRAFYCLSRLAKG